MIDKNWYKSVTAWGGILMVVVFALGFFGITVTTPEQGQLAQSLANIGTAVGEIVGLIMIIIGRRNAGKQIKMLKAAVTKSLPGDEEFPKNWIWLFEKLFGTTANAAFSSGIFLITSEGKELIAAVIKAAKSEKGKLLIEQLKKL